MSDAPCKICGSTSLELIAHTARCKECAVLLRYPYPDRSELPGWQLTPEESRVTFRKWYVQSARLNHENFTNAIEFTIDDAWEGEKFTVLDFGGGGGQFAMVLRSRFYTAEVHLVDANDHCVIDEWAGVNHVIKFADFPEDQTQFDLIFLNDVFEHIEDPVGTLRMLNGKLKAGGKIFIDTPRQFWLYSLLRLVARQSLYVRLLRATVSKSHLQIWSDQAFELAVREAGLRINKLEKVNEFTMPVSYYLENPAISALPLKAVGGIFYRLGKYIARNKIRCVLSHS
jgi:2-polyprenyl-3-methyl-5-hydroxy-6-metoxy-1,4-benzoquinol methylase